MNERFGEKVKAIFDSITVLQAKDSDLKRDNANINGDSPMGLCCNMVPIPPRSTIWSI